MNIADILPKLLKELSPSHIGDKPGDWYNIAPLGKLLKAKGIEYKGKLKEELSKVDGIELYEDRNKKVPVTYVRITEIIISKQDTNNEKKIKPHNNERNALFEWAFMGYNYDETLKQLKEKALGGESWRFENEPEGKLSILDNYLRYSFFRIQKEDKIIYTKDSKWAIFNTGLVNKNYLPIYALFAKNIKNKQPWFFKEFIAEGDKSRIDRISVVNFPSKPLRAQYFKDPSDLLYVVSETGNELAPNYEHIITDNVERLPIALLKECVSDTIEEKKQRKDFQSDEEYYEYSLMYKSDLQKKVEQGKIARKLKDCFRSAIDVTRNRILWNYKTAIPTYYPKSDKISLLLPLCLVNEDRVDLALVVSKGDGGYLAETIYPLDWAYKYARLICRPDSDWLTPSTISSIEDGND